ncbi:MAG TPA: D-alanyl-D-alanine carboxypeptidase family protein [Gaiellaceae bacterium]|nr:D-alanyl-D-alanine carboxypeptidase family protein [Gaiellaceae bacterium]
MAFDAAAPAVPRDRRRRRYRLRRLAPLGLAVVTAFAAGAWAGAPRHATPAAASPPAQKPASHPSTLDADQPTAKPAVAVAPVKPAVHGPALLAGKLHYRLAAASAILVDAGTGQVLFAKHAHERRPIASTTKIMTALLALQVLAPNELVTVSPAVTRVPLVREGLRAGEVVRAWKIFYSMLLYSGNDDALELAIASAGTKQAFLRRMNAEAADLGMKDTHYTSPSGVIDDDNYSSAWDLATVARVALKNPRFAKIVRTKQIRVPWSAPTNSKIYINNNLMLREYPGANGVKTGFTHKAGWCLVTSATRHGRTLIAVVLDSPNMYVDSTKLLDLGFSS